MLTTLVISCCLVFIFLQLTNPYISLAKNAIKHTTTETYLISYRLANIHNIIKTISLAAYANAKYGLVFYLQYELRLADQRVQQIKNGRRPPFTFFRRNGQWSTGGEVKERTDSRFPLRHYSQQKRVSRVNAAVYDRPWHSFPYGFDNKQGEMASCGISATMV